MPNTFCMGESTLLIGAAVIGLYLWSKKTHGGNLVFYPGNITSLSFQGINPEIGATILIQNPSNSEFSINSFAGNVYSNDTLIGNASNFQQAYIPPNSQVEYPITLLLNPIGLTDTIVSAIQNRNTPITLRIDSKVNADNIQLSVPIEFKINS